MKVLNHEEFINGKWGECVYFVEVYKQKIKILAEIERWEEYPKKYDNDPYRINYFPFDWEWQDVKQLYVLDKCNLPDISINMRESHAGGITFGWEEKERAEFIAFRNVYDAFLGFLNPAIFLIKNDEFKDIVRFLTSGMYIFVILDVKQREK